MAGKLEWLHSGSVKQCSGQLVNPINANMLSRNVKQKRLEDEKQNTNANEASRSDNKSSKLIMCKLWVNEAN